MTLRALLNKADELERIASELRAMAYQQGPVTEESAEPPREGDTPPGDDSSKVKTKHG